MSSADRFKPYVPDVRAVVRLEEALPSEHPVHVFIDLVRSVDLAHVVIPPGPKGEKPYHPDALFGVLAWGYLHGVRSARKLARLARQEATFVYLAGGGRPHYRTLARFRRDNAAAFTAVFQETVVLALHLVLARLGHVAMTIQISTDDPRSLKALALLETADRWTKAHRKADGRSFFVIPSSSGRVYWTDQVSCTCSDATHRGATCKHQLAVRLWNACQHDQAQQPRRSPEQLAALRALIGNE